MADQADVAGAGYALSVHPGRPHARLLDASGEAWAELSLVAAVDAVAGPDVTTWLGEPVREEADGCVRFRVEQGSTAWAAKRVLVEAYQDRVELSVEVEGDGRVLATELLGGRWLGDARHPSGRCPSGAGFASVFNPEPSRCDVRTAAFDAAASIDVVGASTPGTEHWFFTPAPFCFAMSRSAPPADTQALPPGPWMTAGLAAAPGQNLFTAYRYQALENSWSLVLDHEGELTVAGRWRSPAVILRLGHADPYAGLARHAADLRARGAAPAAAAGSAPAWWSRPIFCGWGAQVAEAALAGGHPSALSTQAGYDRWLGELERHGIVPGTVVIDDKWQRTYGCGEPDGDRWPDLRGWIAARHERGQKVLLWWKAWDPEGLPGDACVTTPEGRPLAADPESPVYERILRSSVRAMLAPEGLDADGFKVDFTARTPSGFGLRHAGGRWGVELLHHLLWLLHDEAKRVKPDALVMTHTPNPYFGDVTDMIRLNDVAVERPVVAQMRHRAAVARAVLPGHLVDTDNWPMPDREQWRAYVAAQRELGVPSLYFATHLSFSGEALTEADYALVREAWAAEPVAP